MPQERKVGITHFPASAEQRRQQKVRLGKADAGNRSTRTSGKSGHRISRKQGAQSSVEAEGSFAGKGGKGGKSRGSRAGLLAPSRKVRNKGIRRRSR